MIVTVLRTTCELETYIVAVERIREYAEVATEVIEHLNTYCQCLNNIYELCFMVKSFIKHWIFYDRLSTFKCLQYVLKSHLSKNQSLLSFNFWLCGCSLL